MKDIVLKSVMLLLLICATSSAHHSQQNRAIYNCMQGDTAKKIRKINNIEEMMGAMREAVAVIAVSRLASKTGYVPVEKFYHVMGKIIAEATRDDFCQLIFMAHVSERIGIDEFAEDVKGLFRFIRHCSDQEFEFLKKFAMIELIEELHNNEYSKEQLVLVKHI